MMESRENSLPVRMRAAERMVRSTVQRNCSARGCGKVFRMHQETDIVYADDHRHGTA